jgi:hypothetical protein
MKAEFRRFGQSSPGGSYFCPYKAFQMFQNTSSLFFPRRSFEIQLLSFRTVGEKASKAFLSQFVCNELRTGIDGIPVKHFGQFCAAMNHQ